MVDITKILFQVGLVKLFPVWSDTNPNQSLCSIYRNNPQQIVKGVSIYKADTFDLF